MANEFLLIIDGSSLLSTQYYGNLPREVLYAKREDERAQYYHKLMQTSTGVYTNGVFGFFKTLFSILKHQKPKYLCVCWDRTRDTFRREIYKDYKGNRKQTPEPLSAQFALCQQMLTRIGVAQFSSDDFEADDYAGSISLAFKNQIPVTVMTKDHDYLQLVDEQVSMWLVTSSSAKAQELYRKHGVKAEDYIVPDTMFYLTPQLVKAEFGYMPDKTVMVKALAGDGADNIPGVKGIGEKTAVALANAYPSVLSIYDEIRDLSESELDVVKKRWKAELGINRSPMKYLLAESEEELVGEKAAGVCEQLATIKRDVFLGELTLDALVTVVDAGSLEQVLHELEFQSLSADMIAPEFLGGESAVSNVCVSVLTPSVDACEELLVAALQQPVVAVSVLYEEDAQTVSEPSQMNLFDYMSGDSAGESDAQTERTGREHIRAIAFADSAERSVLLSQQGGFTEQMLHEVLVRCYASDAVTVAFDVKEQLRFLSRRQRGELMLVEDSRHLPAYDIAVAAYLRNPLKSQYTPYDVCMEESISVPNRSDIIGKDAVSALSDERMADLLTCVAKEAAAAVACHDKLTRQLKDSGMWQLYCEIEMPTLYTLCEMEANGVLVRREALRQYGDRLLSSIEQLEQGIYERVGHEFNINSPKQLGVVLFEELGLPAGKKTKTGYSTSADVLEGLKSQSLVVGDILEYRQLTKLYSTYAQGLSTFIAKDGRIHGHFNQTVTATGRISSNDPNLQNIPMRTELGRQIRRVFVPHDDAVFVDADYSQIELRILAHMSGDDNLINAFRHDLDIHAQTASQVFHVPFDEVTPLQRRNAKAVNFGIVYGISAHGLSQDLGISRKEASEYMDSYFEGYPKIKQCLEHLVDAGHRDGYVRTLYGRVRPIPELHSTNFNQRQFGERVAMNSPIQGTAADIMKIAMIRTYRGLLRAGLQSRLVLQIHDELLVETERTELDEVKAIVADAMSHAASLDVELAIDMKVGSDWYESK